MAEAEKDFVDYGWDPSFLRMTQKNKKSPRDVIPTLRGLCKKCYSIGLMVCSDNIILAFRP
jgi:hypothetical protein